MLGRQLSFNDSRARNLASSPAHTILGGFIEKKIAEARGALLPSANGSINVNLMPGVHTVQYDDDGEEEGNHGIGRETLTSSTHPFQDSSAILPIHIQASSNSGLPFRWHAPELMVQFMSNPHVLMVLSSTAYSIGTSLTPVVDRFQIFQATYKFPYPLTLLFLQLLLHEMYLTIYETITMIVFQIQSSRPVSTKRYDIALARRLLPISLFFVFYQMGRMFCLEYVPSHIFIALQAPLVLTQLVLTKWFSPTQSLAIHVAVSCVILTLGFCLSSFPIYELGKIPWQGIVGGLVACTCLPLQLSLLKLHLPNMSHDHISLMRTVLFTSTMFLVPCMILSGEIFGLAKNCYNFGMIGFWSLLSGISLLSFLANFSSVIALSFITPLTAVVLGSVANVLQVNVYGTILGKVSEIYVVSTINYLGVSISLMGAGSYLWYINRDRL